MRTCLSKTSRRGVTTSCLGSANLETSSSSMVSLCMGLSNIMMTSHDMSLSWWWWWWYKHTWHRVCQPGDVIFYGLSNCVDCTSLIDIKFTIDIMIIIITTIVIRGNSSASTSRRVLSTRWCGKGSTLAARPWQVFSYQQRENKRKQKQKQWRQIPLKW